MSKERPKEVEQAILAGDRAKLRELGKAGAQRRAENALVKEFYDNEEFQSLSESQERVLHNTYPNRIGPDGEELDEGWYKSEAQAIASAILKMRERQKKFEKRN